MRTTTIDETRMVEARPLDSMELEPWEIRLAEGFLEALDRRDGHSIIEALAEGASWSVTAAGATLARFEGRAAILEMLTESLLRSEGTLRIEVEGLTAGEHEATAIVRFTGHRPGIRLDGEYRFTLRLEHGLISEVIQSPEDLVSHRDFFATRAGAGPTKQPARVTIVGNGLPGFKAASSIVRLLKARGATVVGGGAAGHDLSEFVLEVPAAWLPRLDSRKARGG